jgi:hypothetical protein
MPIWKITPKGPVQVTETTLKEEQLVEQHLEDWLIANHELLGERLLVIGRQVMIPDIRDRVDVLAVDAQGNAVIVELKRGKLKDPVDMQALRYASYIAKWSFEDFENQARIHLGKVGDPDFNFNEIYEDFCTEAGADEVPDLNSDQRLIIVGSEVKAKLGSVALWLHEHNVDIKVIEVEFYREEDTLFLQPQIIVPLPVSRFIETGRPKGGEGARPWLENGKNWHLMKRCSPQTQQMLLRLDDLIRDICDVDGPRWSQKFYVAYRVGNYNWLAVHTRATMLRLDFLVKAGSFSQLEVAEELGIKQFDKDESLAEKLELPSSVYVKNRNENSDHIRLRIKDDFDLESEAFLAFLEKAYRAFPK